MKGLGASDVNSVPQIVLGAKNVQKWSLERNRVENNISPDKHLSFLEVKGST